MGKEESLTTSNKFCCLRKTQITHFVVEREKGQNARWGNSSEIGKERKMETNQKVSCNKGYSLELLRALDSSTLPLTL